ncbi:MAG: PilN domain-containing protein [Candidatus Eremiobacteraeota bacterium]|nr:PilN domain-containing protein [Candidatus Eremiobacteraeota bacterium]
MIQFDYIRTAKPAFLRRLFEVRVPVQLQAPLFALCAVLCIVSAAWMIEAGRLRAAAAVENAYRKQYDQSRFALSRTRVLYTRLEHLVSLANEVRSFQRSGDAEAARFANIGNRLPPHVWLTSIGNDGTGVAMTGKAGDLSALGATMLGLANATPRYLPVLISAAGDDRASRASIIHYELHLDSQPQ